MGGKVQDSKHHRERVSESERLREEQLGRETGERKGGRRGRADDEQRVVGIQRMEDEMSDRMKV